MRIFLTGTDTGVGKTYVAALLLRAMKAAGMRAAGFKPICCGGREDAEWLLEAGDPSLTVNDVNPIWFRAPASPYTASLVENRPIDMALIRETYAKLCSEYDGVVVEGVGGWRVPILKDFEMADLAEEFGLPVAIVSANKLGTINHTLLTIESIQVRKNVRLAGVILNYPGSEANVATASNRAILEELIGVPLLLDVFPGQDSVILPEIE